MKNLVDTVNTFSPESFEQKIRCIVAIWDSVSSSDRDSLGKLASSLHKVNEPWKAAAIDASIELHGDKTGYVYEKKVRLKEPLFSSESPVLQKQILKDLNPVFAARNIFVTNSFLQSV